MGGDSKFFRLNTTRVCWIETEFNLGDYRANFVRLDHFRCSKPPLSGEVQTPGSNPCKSMLPDAGDPTCRLSLKAFLETARPGCRGGD
jgi:hypothetical protein